MDAEPMISPPAEALIKTWTESPAADSTPGTDVEEGSSATAEADDALRESLLQPVCEGSAIFLAMMCTFCLLGVGAPIVLLTGLDSAGYDARTAAQWVAVACIVAAVLFLCTGAYHLLLCPPPKPEPSFPLVKQPEIRVPSKVYVLVNPMGGTHGARGMADSLVRPALSAAGIDAEFIETQYAGHGQVLCNTLDLAGVDAIIAIGGDGTFHECVNGLLDRSDGQQCALGLVPGGSGNSFMTDFGLQKSAAAAVQNIVDGRVAAIDALKVEYGPDERHHAWSINVVGYCADHCMAAVNIEGWRGCLGTARYDVCALWGLLKGRSAGVEMRLDGQMWHTGVSALFVNTTQHFGKGMRAAPHAKLDDGLVDVGNIEGSRGAQLRKFTLIKTGQHAPLMEASNAARQAKLVELKMPTVMGVLNVDGEVKVHRHNTIRMEVHPGVFDFYVPSAN